MLWVFKKTFTGATETETSARFCGGESPKWRVDVYVPPFFLPPTFFLLIIQLILKLSCCFLPQLLSLRHLSYQLSSARLLANPRLLPLSIGEFMVLGPLILPTLERFLSLTLSLLFFLILLLSLTIWDLRLPCNWLCVLAPIFVCIIVCYYSSPHLNCAIYFIEFVLSCSRTCISMDS